MLQMFFTPEFMNMLGQLSDMFSDLMPEFLRPVLHIIFTFLLN